MEEIRKTDRRTLYTRKAIRDAFLRLKRGKDYNMITVADLCREAEISRATFYAHFRNLAEVLDTLLDEVLANRDYIMKYLSAAEPGAGYRCSYPFCELVRDRKELRCIFFDSALDHIVLKKLAELYQEDYIREMRQTSPSLSEKDAETLFYFQINGCYAISRQYSGRGPEEWGRVKDMMHRFIQGGTASLPSGEP